ARAEGPERRAGLPMRALEPARRPAPPRHPRRRSGVSTRPPQRGRPTPALPVQAAPSTPAAAQRLEVTGAQTPARRRWGPTPAAEAQQLEAAVARRPAEAVVVAKRLSWEVPRPEPVRPVRLPLEDLPPGPGCPALPEWPVPARPA